MSDAFDINRLSRETGVNVRTIRYYLAEKVLLPPVGRGPAAVYGAGHRDRLRLIRRWQDERLPLAEIRARLGRLDDAGVAAALAGGRERDAVSVTNSAAPELAAAGSASAATTRGHTARTDSAADYVRRVLGSGVVAGAPASPAPAAPPGQTPPRTTWERIALTPEIELHVRRPLGRADQRRLEALLAHAARLFDGGD